MKIVIFAFFVFVISSFCSQCTLFRQEIIQNTNFIATSNLRERLVEKVVAYDKIAVENHLLSPQNLIVSIKLGNSGEIEKKDLGDAPIWTAYYLASQSYRYAITKDVEALNNARRALKGIKSLFDVTGERGLMARYYFIDEYRSGDDIFPCKNVPNCFFKGDVSRDQYIGVMFGLGAAYNLLPNTEKDTIRSIVSDVMYFMEKNDWKIKNADGKQRFGGIMHPGNLFAIGSASHVLAFAQVYKNVGGENGDAKYAQYAKHYAKMLDQIYLVTSLDYGYFAIQLHYASFFNLVRVEEDDATKSIYRKKFLEKLWRLTGDHKNALFNSMYIVVMGYDSDIVREIKFLLGEFPDAPRRNFALKNSARRDVGKRVSLLGIVMLENNVVFAEDPLPIEKRPPTDFLWQRSPFVLDGGGDGSLEYPGLDFLLPYWMGRYYGFIGEYD